MKLPFSFSLLLKEIRKYLLLKKGGKNPLWSHWEPKLVVQKMGFVGGVYLLLFIPIIGLLFHAFNRSKEIALIRDQIDYLGIRMERVKKMEKGYNAFIKNHGNRNPNFIEEAIEPMVFLNPEIEGLKLVCAHPAFGSCENIRGRLEKLTGKENRLQFLKKGKKVQNGVEEAILVQKQPVEVNTHDIKKILSNLEGSFTNHPQFIVRYFQLDRKKLAEREGYLLNMELISRSITYE